VKGLPSGLERLVDLHFSEMRPVHQLYFLFSAACLLAIAAMDESSQFIKGDSQPANLPNKIQIPGTDGVA
jgi:hypothetical protein